MARGVYISILTCSPSTIVFAYVTKIKSTCYTYCTVYAIHRACMWFNCSKQHSNALNVHKNTKIRAKSRKYGRYTGDFPQMPVYTGIPVFIRATWAHWMPNVYKQKHVYMGIGHGPNISQEQRSPFQFNGQASPTAVFYLSCFQFEVTLKVS